MTIMGCLDSTQRSLKVPEKASSLEGTFILGVVGFNTLAVRMVVNFFKPAQIF